MKKFKEYLNKSIARKQTPDNSRANSLIEDSEKKDKFWKKIQTELNLSDENANCFIETCYDIIIGLIRAKLYIDGYKCSGNGAHEAEVCYLNELGFSENDVRFMDELRYFRNGIKYYGKDFDKEYAEKVLDFKDKMVLKLKKLF